MSWALARTTTTAAPTADPTAAGDTATMIMARTVAATDTAVARAVRSPASARIRAVDAPDAVAKSVERGGAAETR